VAWSSLRVTHAAAGLARMSRQAARRQVQCKRFLVREDRLHQAWLADDAPFGLQPAVGDVGDQPLRAAHIGFLVICNEQMYAALEGTRHQRRDGGEAAGDKPFYVGRAPAV
jgi:hypothetical protein